MDVDAALRALVRGEPLGRVCVVVAHPDDEVAFAGLCLADRGTDVHLVHLTDGAPADPWFARQAGCDTREAYAALRQRELGEALGVLGLARAHRSALGARDQEAAAALPELTRALARVLEDTRPALVLTHAYEGGHPDHDAAAFASRAAIELARRAGAPVPALAEFAGYRAGEGRTLTTELLPRGLEARTLVRSPGADELERKRRALDRFRSQRDVLRRLAWDREQLRPAPVEDFGAPPHPGTLHFEQHGWALDGAGFRGHVARAAAALGVQKVLP